MMAAAQAKHTHPTKWSNLQQQFVADRPTILCTLSTLLLIVGGRASLPPFLPHVYTDFMVWLDPGEAHTFHSTSEEHRVTSQMAPSEISAM
jgi:hypothetical protein